MGIEGDCLAGRAFGSRIVRMHRHGVVPDLRVWQPAPLPLGAGRRGAKAD